MRLGVRREAAQLARSLGHAALVAAVATLVVTAGITTAARTASAAPDPDPPAEVELVLFWGDGCPHCEHERAFLEELVERWPAVEIVEFEVWNDAANRQIFRETLAELGEEPRAVPTTVIGARVWVGFSDSIADQIEDEVAARLGGPDPAAGPPEADADEREVMVDVPGVGSVDLAGRSLVVSTIVIAFVDGVNPCSLWVLSILLALVLHSGSRARVLLVGTVFLIVTSALYGLFIVGAYSALDYVDRMSWIRIAVAVVAGVFGVIHLWGFLEPRRAVLHIPDARKPGLYRRMRELAGTDRALPAVLAGTATLAIGVSLLETPCSAGLPLLWTDLLAANDVPARLAVTLFALYLSVFLVDELVLFGAAVITMRATRMQESHGRLLVAMSGALMVVLAVAIVAAPELLESLAGTLVVFTTAGVFVLALLAADRLRSARRTL